MSYLVRLVSVNSVKSKFKKSQLIVKVLKQADGIATQNQWSKALEQVQGHLSSILSRVQSILTVSISSVRKNISAEYFEGPSGGPSESYKSYKF